MSNPLLYFGCILFKSNYFFFYSKHVIYVIFSLSLKFLLLYSYLLFLSINYFLQIFGLQLIDLVPEIYIFLSDFLSFLDHIEVIFEIIDDVDFVNN